ncbi:MAG: hypothetical protein JWM10_3145 [Myxococcaceae bacterium]|nr:hypothetical protein [Myxococcaceae bacterium]
MTRIANHVRSASGGREQELAEHLASIGRDVSWLREFNWSHDLGIAHIGIADLEERLVEHLSSEPAAAEALGLLREMVEEMGRLRALDVGDADSVSDEAWAAMAAAKGRLHAILADIVRACGALAVDSPLGRSRPDPDGPVADTHEGTSIDSRIGPLLRRMDAIVAALPASVLEPSVGREELGDALERLGSLAAAGADPRLLALLFLRSVLLAVWNTQRMRLKRALGSRLPP